MGRGPRVQMARRVNEPRTSGARLPLLIVLVLLVGLGGGWLILSRPRADQVASVTASAGPTSPAVAALPTGSQVTSPTSTPATPTNSPADATSSPAASPHPARTPRPAATASQGRLAPRTAAEFNLERQVIDIAFPISTDIEYRYRDNWLDRRAGRPDPYNHARLDPDGRDVRLHDGIDIYGPEGAPVVAPFAGRVIDPAQRWQPWEPDRYGLTVVIESTEPGTQGYTSILVHLDEVWVAIGERVERGEVIGVLGRTGNAEEVRPQLHFELRAPFLLDWSPLGYDRLVDAFNPYPSLAAADPKN